MQLFHLHVWATKNINSIPWQHQNANELYRPTGQTCEGLSIYGDWREQEWDRRIHFTSLLSDIVGGSKISNVTWSFVHKSISIKWKFARIHFNFPSSSQSSRLISSPSSRFAIVQISQRGGGFDGIYAKLIRNIRSSSDLSPKNERYVRNLHLVNKCGRWEFDATFPIKLFYILRWGSFYLVFIALASETKKRRSNGRMNESTLNLAFKSHHEKKTHRRPSSSWLT